MWTGGVLHPSVRCCSVLVMGKALGRGEAPRWAEYLNLGEMMNPFPLLPRPLFYRSISRVSALPTSAPTAVCPLRCNTPIRAFPLSLQKFSHCTSMCAVPCAEDGADAGKGRAVVLSTKGPFGLARRPERCRQWQGGMA